ncbi:MAG: UDP-N-acetylmuramoyl-L-alanyl-D-glutamate--2,6-diaminopimelate ligase [Candidatus Hatepunaea meridiana]|nr:UDP-N-acetylmuramoyl-L-alanyl-D-glutamate--2,6-diaminopimelate ligase [Candidatus Hatepunaea meridiana]
MKNNLISIDLKPLLDDLQIISISGRIPDEVVGITQDSRLVEPGFVFAARSGSNVKGIDFIHQASDKGAVLVISDDEIPDGVELPFIQVADFHQALVHLSKAIYRDPTSKLKLIAITGTNGKTSSVFLIKSILSYAGEKCGLLSTIGYDTHKRLMDAPLTTPDIDWLNALLNEMVEAGCGWAVMEASSHALYQGRLDGLSIAAAGYTNLSVEHLDYHRTLEEYAQAKALLFEKLSIDAVAVINIGDSWSKVMIEASPCSVITYYLDESGRLDTPVRLDERGRLDIPVRQGIEESGKSVRPIHCIESDKSVRPTDLKVEALEHSLCGGRFLLKWLDQSIEVCTPLIGVYQGENIALAAGIMRSLGIDTDYIKAGIEGLIAIPGRMEAIIKGQPFSVFVDFSHTPDALKNALESIRSLCKGSLIVVFGAGGDRDRTKRPEMGKVVSMLADRIIITNDNPRTEDPNRIADDIMQGILSDKRAHTIIQLNRRAAIWKAFLMSSKGDAVIVAGKGAEATQDVNGMKTPFDDRKVALEELARLG